MIVDAPAAEPRQGLERCARASGVRDARDAGRPRSTETVLRGARESVGGGGILERADRADPVGERGLGVLAREVCQLEVGVRVDESGDEARAGKLERARAGRRRDQRCGTNSGDDAAVVNENGAVLDGRRRDGMDRARADA